MRCPACDAENIDDAPQCADCGATFSRRPRKRDDSSSSETPFSKRAVERNPLAVKAYRIGVFALIPGVGLVLGPIALVLGLIAWNRGRLEPPNKRGGHVTGALLVGSLLVVTNWLGILLMWLGLSGK